MAEKRKSRLDYLIDKLTLNSVQFETMPGGGDQPNIDAMMVHASLGMGNGTLSKEAYLLSRAVYVDDKAHEMAMRTLGAEHVHRLFVDHNWSASKPYASYLRGLNLNEIELKRQKQLLARMMPLLFSQLAITEIANNGNCMSCHGSGRTKKYRDCKSCSGTGKRPLSERYKAEFILMNDDTNAAYKQWHRTWRNRYQEIYLMFSNWELEFFAHLVKYYG